MNLTYFDYFIFLIMFFLTLLGLLRGLIRELFSLLTWIGSGTLIVALRPIITNLILQKISNPLIANAISSSLIFIIAIVGLSILASNLSKTITTKIPSSINMTLGIAFGFTKGFIISSLIFATIINIFDDGFNLKDKFGPGWLQKSATYRPLSFGAFLILPVVDPILNEMKGTYSIPSEDLDKKVLNKNTKKETELIKIEDEKKSKKEKDEGYTKDQIDKLDHLIDLTM
ncbi:MAG: CvpA family protein [Rickettsiales bacterium]|nr:CvpA family protein [Rickettsiales bacterium]